MSLRIRVGSYLEFLLAMSPDGLTFDELALGVMILEGEMRFSVESEICYGMKFKEKPYKEHFFLGQKEESSFISIEPYKEWAFVDGKYLPSSLNRLDTETQKEVEDSIKNGPGKGYSFSPLWWPKICQYFVESSYPNGLSFDELSNNVRSIPTGEHYYDNRIPEALGLKRKPTKECHYLDQKDTKEESLEEFYHQFTDWHLKGDRYFLSRNLSESDISRKNKLIKNRKSIMYLNKNLKNAIRNTLAGQLCPYACKKGLANFEYMREFALMFSNIKSQGIHFKKYFRI